MIFGVQQSVCLYVRSCDFHSSRIRRARFFFLLRFCVFQAPLQDGLPTQRLRYTASCTIVRKWQWLASPWQRLASVSCTISTWRATDSNGTQDPTWTQQPAAGSVVCVNRRKSHSHEHPFRNTSKCRIPSPLNCNAAALQSCNVRSLERYNPIRSGNC